MKIIRKEIDNQGWQWKMDEEFVLRGRSPDGKITTESTSTYSPIGSARPITTIHIQIFDKKVPRTPSPLEVQFDTSDTPAEYLLVRDLATIQTTH